MGNYCLSRQNQTSHLMFLDEKEKTVLKEKFTKLSLNDPM